MLAVAVHLRTPYRQPTQYVRQAGVAVLVLPTQTASTQLDRSVEALWCRAQSVSCWQGARQGPHHLQQIRELAASAVQVVRGRLADFLREPEAEAAAAVVTPLELLAVVALAGATAGVAVEAAEVRQPRGRGELVVPVLSV